MIHIKWSILATQLLHMGHVALETMTSPCHLPRPQRPPPAPLPPIAAGTASFNPPACCRAGDNESLKCHLSGIIVRDLSISVSNYRSTRTLDDFCKEQGVAGIADVDTRRLTRILRDSGCVNGVISSDPSAPDGELVAMARQFDIVGRDLLSVVTREDTGNWEGRTDAEWEFNPAAAGEESRFKVVAYDFGIKTNILRRLASLGCSVTVVPASTPAADVLAMNPDGIFFSNGPVRSPIPRTDPLQG